MDIKTYTKAEIIRRKIDQNKAAIEILEDLIDNIQPRNIIDEILKDIIRLEQEFEKL